MSNRLLGECCAAAVTSVVRQQRDTTPYKSSTTFMPSTTPAPIAPIVAPMDHTPIPAPVVVEEVKVEEVKVVLPPKDIPNPLLGGPPADFKYNDIIDPSQLITRANGDRMLGKIEPKSHWFSDRSVACYNFGTICLVSQFKKYGVEVSPPPQQSAHCLPPFLNTGFIDFSNLIAVEIEYQYVDRADHGRN
jgi:hypothetical protein